RVRRALPHPPRRETHPAAHRAAGHAALRTRKVPVAYLLIDGEQHGFRRVENIRRALDAELSFYAQVFGFKLPPEEGIEPVTVENAENL
ncbi:MAG: hypothetical protein ACRDQU_10550, partial [Pseudonocardiaceae bacterium]